MTDTPGPAVRLQRLGTAIENAALVILLGALILLAVLQIVLRVFFSFGFVWADELVRLLVLWIALVASIAASRGNRHLRIDILSHFVAEKYARVPRIIVDAFAAVMCGILAWHSWRYLNLVVEFGDTVLVDLPAWIAYALLPVSFALMCYRFILSVAADLVLAFRPPKGDGQ